MNSQITIFWCILLLVACKNEKQWDHYSNAKSDISAYNLINPKEAAVALASENKNYIAIQVSKASVYAQAHLPGALNIWRPDYGSTVNDPYGGLIPSRKKLQTLLQKLGYTSEKTLLLYDAKANVDALRFAWVLNLYGFDNFKIINGGLANWKTHNLPTNAIIPDPPKSTNFILDSVFNNNMIANFEGVKIALTDTNTILVDTREPYEYLGQPFNDKGTIRSFKKGAFGRGSIPGAIHLNWSTFADLDGDHTIKSERDLRHDLALHGIDDEKEIILYCHSGSRTSHTYYVLKHVLGFEQVKNYDGSWIEWSYMHTQDASVPIEQICTNKRFNDLKDSLTLRTDSDG